MFLGLAQTDFLRNSGDKAVIFRFAGQDYDESADGLYRVAVGPYVDADSTAPVKNELERRGFQTFLRHWSPK